MLKRRRIDILFGIAYISLMALLVAFLVPTEVSGEDMVEVYSLNVDGITDVMTETITEVQEDLENVKLPKYESIGIFITTAYCPCYDCSSVWGWQTSTGAIAKEGVTIAVDPNVIPYGTVVYIEGMGEYIAQDCGSAINENDIDIFFESHSVADAWGVQEKEIFIKITE